jgi:hemoglobin/transferrin/lactoferrin receptor protein
MLEGYQPLELVIDAGEAHDDLVIELKPWFHRINERVSVTAARKQAFDFDLSRSISTINSKELLAGMPRSTPEALSEIHGVFVQKTNHGGGSPIIRGLVGNQVLVLIDGIRLNNATYRYGPNQYLTTVDPSSVERIELIRGPESVLYGSDSLGGVINVITDKPGFTSEHGEIFGRVSPNIVSSGMEQSIQARLGARGRRLSSLVGGVFRNFGHLRAGKGLGVEEPSGYREYAGDGSAQLRIGSRSLLHVAYQHVRQEDVPRFDQVRQRGYAVYSFDPQVRQLGYLRFETSTGSALLSLVKTCLSFQRSLEGRLKRREGSAIENRETDKIDVWGASIEAHSGQLLGWRMITGVDLYHDDVSSFRKDTDLADDVSVLKRGLYPDGATMLSAALFGQLLREWRLFSCRAGARLTGTRSHIMDATFGELGSRNQALVGMVDVHFNLSASHHLYASISQGFRSPNIDDASTLGAFDFGVEVPSPDLRPERSLTYEAGYKTRNRLLAAALCGYQTRLSDFIERVPGEYEGSILFEDQKAYRRANVGRATIRGAEAQIAWRILPHLSFSSTLSWTIGEQDATDEPMRRIPPLHGSVGLRFSPSPGHDCEAILLFAGRQDRLSSGDIEDHRIAPGGTPGWKILNIRGQIPLCDDLDLVGGIGNVFDEAYRIHGSGIDGAGRHLWAALHFRF